MAQQERVNSRPKGGKGLVSIWTKIPTVAQTVRKEASAYPHANSSYGNGISHMGTAHLVSIWYLDCVKVVPPEGQLRHLTSEDQGEE